jgi:hypothetical protein
MIVGEGGVEVPGSVATKNDTLRLVRYWATEIIHLDFAFFLYGSSGSSEWRTREFASRRLTTISKLIGEEEVTKAFRQTEQAQEGRSGEVARDTKEGQQMSVRECEVRCGVTE